MPLKLHSSAVDVATYQAVGEEYYDQTRHPTSSNFNLLSRRYIEESIADFRHMRPALEVGAGRSTLAPLMEAWGEPLESITISDASPSMLAHSRIWEARGVVLEIGDAEELRYLADSFALVVAGLADPYNTPRFWGELARVLRLSGKAVVTMPAFDWASRYRHQEPGARLDYASFELADGRQLQLPSKLYPLDMQVAMIQSSGLTILEFKALTAELIQGPLSPKAMVYGNSYGPLVWGFCVSKTRTVA